MGGCSLIVSIKSNPGVFENEDGKQGYTVDGHILVEAEYESIMPYGQTRLIVRKDGKDGVLAIDGETVSELVPCIFKELTAAKKHRYGIKMSGGYSEAHTEEFLQSVQYQTDDHLVLKTKDGRLAVYFHSRQIGVYDELAYLGKDIFIARNSNGKYGLIRCGTVKVEEIRPFEYTKIELSADKRNVLLTKTGRPRFISLYSLLS